MTVEQYDLSGNLLKEWSHAREASDFLEISRQLILRALKHET